MRATTRTPEEPIELTPEQIALMGRLSGHVLTVLQATDPALAEKMRNYFESFPELARKPAAGSVH